MKKTQLGAEEELCLIKNIQSNSRSASADFSKLFCAYKPFIQSVCWKLLSKNKNWAEDITQEAEIALFDAVRGFDSSRGFSFEAYAAKVILSKVCSFLRGLVIQPKITYSINGDAQPYSYNDTGEGSVISQIHYSEAQNPMTTSVAGIDMEYFLSENTLKTCSCTNREVEVVKYHFIEGLKKSEIAMTLNISPKRVSELIDRACTKLLPLVVSGGYRFSY